MGMDAVRQHLIDLSQDFVVEGRRLHPHPCIITVGPPHTTHDCPAVEEFTFRNAGPCLSIWGLFDYAKSEEVKLFGCATSVAEQRFRDLATAAWSEVGTFVPALLPNSRLSAGQYGSPLPWVRWLLLCFDVAWSPLRPSQLIAVQTGWFTADNGIMQTITTGDLDALSTAARVAYCRDVGIDPEKLPKHFYAELKPDAFRASALVAEVLAQRLAEVAGVSPTPTTSIPASAGQSGAPLDKRKPRGLKRCERAAGESIEAAGNACEDLIPVAGKSPPHRTWLWVRDNFYPKGKCPDEDVWRRYLRAYYADGDSAQARPTGLGQPTRSMIRASDQPRR